jgi:hypothetical protein
LLSEAVAEGLSDDRAEADWLGDWQRCLLDGAFRALEAHQRQSPGNLFCTGLRLSPSHTQPGLAGLSPKGMPRSPAHSASGRGARRRITL